MSQPSATAYQRALHKLSRLHRDEFADLLVAERLRMGMAAERDKLRCGTRSSYAHGCRCDRCREAHREYSRERQHKRVKRGIGPGDPRHGSIRGYAQGCRCDRCREANTAYHREYRKRRRARKAAA